MAHPYLEHAMAFGGCEVCNVFEKRRVSMGAHFSVTKFTGLPTFYFSAELLRHGLHAIANAQNWNSQLKDDIRCVVSGFFVHAGVAARQNDAF